MTQLRKGTPADLEAIIKTANGAFIPHRTDSFDFVKIMPKAYRAPNNTAESHFVVEEDGQMVAVAGNLLIDFPMALGKLSLVGSVATLPDYQGKGYMAEIMQAIDQENIDNDVVASILTGRRDRYARWGYSPMGHMLVYTFDKSFGRYTNASYPHANGFSESLAEAAKATLIQQGVITNTEWETARNPIELRVATEEDVPAILASYKASIPMPIRTKESLWDVLHTEDSTPYCVVVCGNVVGYMVYCARKIKVLELVANGIEAYVLAMLVREIQSGVSVVVSPLLPRLARALDPYCNTRAVSDNLLVKVYRPFDFLRMAVRTTLAVNSEVSIDKELSIDGAVYRIKAQKDSVSINALNRWELDGPCMEAFLHKAFWPGQDALSLIFDVLPLDMF